MRVAESSSKSRWLSRLFCCALLTGGFGPAACVIAPDQVHMVDGVVMVAPPPPQPEESGSPPEPGFIWMSGYWSWVGTRHVWVPGRWSPPRRGYHWVAHQWVRQGDGWRLHGGHWARDS
ncbi:MAG TPA: YXWGXW repeat-containing protein [Steroidobacteraceae bacterium]|nr:YXWGXW repeat-containing protein [Steroidobacteraceae bacterium]